MRVAKFSRTLLLLALPVVPAACALAQEHPNVQPSTVRDQLTKPAVTKPDVTKPAVTKPEVAKPAVTKPAPATSQTPPAAQGKAPAPSQSAVQTPAAGKAQPNPATKEPAKATAQKPAKPPVEKPAEQKTSVARRDTFDMLLNKPQTGNATPQNLPPGKAGLVVSTLRIDGIVHGTGGAIAIVSNPQQRVYFLREGDKLYDGSVEHITLEAITFHEFGKDAFGKPLEHEVTKRLYPSPGELQ
jgi:hypothetical protein